MTGKTISLQTALLAAGALLFSGPGAADGAWYWKDWNGPLPGGYMPDINQNQDFNDDGVIEKDYCAPTAEADSIRWFGNKANFDPGFAWAKNITGGLNDLQLVQTLAWYKDTNGQRTGITHGGTYIPDELAGEIAYLNDRGLGPDNHPGGSWFQPRLVYTPTFDWVESEVERCEDVKLDVIFTALVNVPGVGPVWAGDGGHAVTVAGIDSEAGRIALSDPDDGVNADGSDVAQYPVYQTSVSPSPCGLWQLDGYFNRTDPFWVNQEPTCCGMDWRIYFSNAPATAIEVNADLWSTEVYAALSLSPVPEPCALLVWSLLGTLGLAVGWWRCRRA